MLKGSRIYFVCALISGMCPFLTAQESQPSPTPVKRKSITMQMMVPKGIHYYYSGVELKGLDGLRGAISPLNDPEANRLLNLSQSSNSTGVVLIIGGGVFIVGGLITAATDPNFTNKNATLDTQEGIGLGTTIAGLVGFYVGAFKIADAQAAEFNAVQRYNAVVLGEGQTGWNLPSHTGFHTDLLTMKF